MGTKLNPGKYDCYNAALPDEETFTVNARDPDFGEVVAFWASLRLKRIIKGSKPIEDIAMVTEANECAVKGTVWRSENDGKWRQPKITQR